MALAGFCVVLAVLIVFSTLALAGESANFYTVEDIATPPNVVPECGGIAFLPDGRLVAVFHHGEVFFYNPATKEWKQFAEGIHDPMGVLAVSEREIIVSQRPELTRLLDTDGDGVADRYECISDGWGLSGNYHEFAFTPVRDKDGGIYVAVSSGSDGSVARYEVRGKFNPDGYGTKSHFSVVPYRGWIVKIAPDGSLTPIASGFRQPNGMALDPQGRLFTTDNQGDWVGTSKLHHVVAGRFYGHAAGLVWRDDFKKGRTLDELDAMRTEGSVLFSHAIMANSPGQPAFAPADGKFGPFAGQMIVPEFNIPRVMRVMLEEVAGEIQGAAVPLYDGAPMRPGTHRTAFAPDGSLYIAQSERKNGWPAGAGIQRLVWNGKVPFDVSAMHLTKTGFDLAFTKPVSTATASDPQSYKVRRYYYEYHEAYGSPQMDIHEVKLSDIRVAPDGQHVSITADTLAPGYIYEFTINGVKSADGAPLTNTLLCYTLNRTLDGKTAPSPRPPPTGESKGSGKDRPKGSSL